ncbi:hypothetical protein E2P81_ATG02545 [Venturia nashicola]|uniref:Uncharacterized protein n=1 Tax=Venturia nashicola TaxID=86259 RepID=A0A4Z1PFY7_9PEZI|nr:hypothetical protein E6O75_ATG02606 [Venturia nashicola]TLD36763.1 hypothetical protein E2P81_ATG02545 [Venturia nashicola]
MLQFCRVLGPWQDLISHGLPVHRATEGSIRLRGRQDRGRQDRGRQDRGRQEIATRDLGIPTRNRTRLVHYPAILLREKQTQNRTRSYTMVQGPREANSGCALRKSNVASSNGISPLAT